MKELYHFLSIGQRLDVNKHHNTKKNGTMIITGSASHRRSHIQMRCGSSIRHCALLSDRTHGYQRGNQ